jgi:uncharacterized DUF497 family protein
LQFEITSELDGVAYEQVTISRGVRILEARARRFTNAPTRTVPDRFVLIGLSRQLRVLFVVSAEAGERIRIITARKASRAQRRSTKMARKNETDLSRYDLTRGTRGKYFEKARRSFETIIVDKKVAATLGGAAQSQSPPRTAPMPPQPLGIAGQESRVASSRNAK